MVRDGWLVTFGITPDAAETDYGWIKVGAEIGDRVHRVERFVEKPPREKADEMLAQGGHTWNGGILLFRADVYLGALASYAPEMLAAAQNAMEKGRREGARIWPDADSFATSPSDSIDYAVMEKAPRVAVVPVAMGWSDVGSLDALHAISHADAGGNVVRGDAVVIESSNCLVRVEPGKRVALVGVDDLIVVVSGDDILVRPRGRCQEVKKVIEAMQSGN